jgi:hypothetical protein
MVVRIALTALLLAAPLAAQAQSYRCVGKDGKKYYGSTIPRPCIGQPVEQLNPQGLVIKRIDPEGEEKEREAREAEAAKKRADEIAAREASRRNRALLATYTSVKDIDDARQRALADNQKTVREVEDRMAQIRKRQAGYEKELEFYKGKNKPPAKLLEDIESAQTDLRYQEELKASKQKEVDGINAKYDEDKRRYLELTGKR